jgi:tetratricopeptide (TPR) repeat protein
MSELEFWKDLGNIFDAILNYQKKNVEFNNRFINPWIRLGNIFERQDQNTEAVQAYKHATEIDPASAQNWTDLGDAHFKNGAYDEAAEAYQMAIKLDPEAGWPLSNLALTLVTQGKNEEAIPLFTASIELLADNKDKAISWNRLGNAYRKLNDYKNAFDAFQKADELDGENTGFRDKLDEVPPSVSIVAPEDILEQMIVEQSLDTEEASTPIEPPALESQPDVEVQLAEALEGISQSELPSEPTAVELSMGDKETFLAEEAELTTVVMNQVFASEATPAAAGEVTSDETQAVEQIAGETMVAEGESSITQEPKADVLQLIEDIIARVEAAAASNETTAMEEPASDAVEKMETGEEQTVEPPVSKTVEVVEASAPLPVQEATIEVETTAVLPNVIVSEEDAVSAANVVALSDAQPVEEPKTQEEFPAESVTTISDVPQEAAVSESTLLMDIVETYTASVSTQPPADNVVSEETAGEATDQVEVQKDADAKKDEVLTLAELIPVEESNVPEETLPVISKEHMTEMAYEEFLNDVVGTSTNLSDHVDDIRSETPLTKVSKNGEVRIVMDTKNAHVWNELGNVYLNAGSHDDAIASYSKAIELDRLFAWPYSNLALAYVQKGRFAEAILLYQRAIELFTSDKDKAITWNRLGSVYRRIHDYDNAIAAYQTADDLDPENTTIFLRSNYGLLGNMYSEQRSAYIV